MGAGNAYTLARAGFIIDAYTKANETADLVSLNMTVPLRSISDMRDNPNNNNNNNNNEFNARFIFRWRHGVPSMQSSYSAGMKRCGICMEERSPFEFDFEFVLKVRRLKSRGDIVQAIDNYDNYGGRDFWYKKVLSRPRKADNESEERICWGREFQMEGEAKENDLWPISDQISGTMRRFLLEDLRDRGGM